MALRKFREFVRDRQRPVSGRLEPNVLEEETDDQDITDVATVIIGSELSVSERKRLTDDLLIDIRKMSKRGDTIIAIAVALA
jgi:hypothetical protein